MYILFLSLSLSIPLFILLDVHVDVIIIILASFFIKRLSLYINNIIILYLICIYM